MKFLKHEMEEKRRSLAGISSKVLGLGCNRVRSVVSRA